MKSPPIILTTDFGLTDEYVGVLKGVIVSANPNAVIIDLSHHIPPQDIARAAELIFRNYRYFPAGSIHLCIVDPGVGTGRRIIVVSGCGQLFLGPDNGVFTHVLKADREAEIYELTNRDWFLNQISSTFHGRDIMAPSAARLSLGAPIDKAGPPLPYDSCVTISTAMPTVSETEIRGTISSIDRFGNLNTTIESGILSSFAGFPQLSIRVKSHQLTFHQASYGQLPDDRPAALINSSGLLEICVKNGNAAAMLKVEIGERVVVQRR